MTYAPTDVRLDPHPEDNSVVLARVGGPRASAARHILLAHTFQQAPDQGAETLVLVRIDHEEPHYADAAARALRQAGITVDVDFELQQDLDSDWTWVNYPVQDLSPQEIRDVGAQAQTIYDDIAAGRLVIHHHAVEDGFVAAVGTYTSGHSVLLHDEDHLRHIAGTFDSKTDAVAEFLLICGSAMRIGPAPATSSEQRIARILAAPVKPDSTRPQAPARTDGVAVYDGDPGNHTELLDTFLAQDGEWEKYRPQDETTIANHESLLLRVEFVHEPEPGEPTWTVAAYESPVGERLWHATATAFAPVEMVTVLLDTLTSGAATATEPAVSEKAIAHVAEALTGWTQSVEGRFIRWSPPRGDGAGVRFDAFAAQALPGRNSRTWTIWGGDDADHPVWAIHLSPQTPAKVLHDLAFELAEGRCPRPRSDRRRPPTPTRLDAPTPTLTVTPPTPVHGSAGPRQAR
jgi:hypothetical protein